MELQSFPTVSFQIAPPISRQLNGFIHIRKSSCFTTTSLRNTWKSRASSTFHRGLCKDFKRNGRPRCSRDEASLESKETRRDFKVEETDNRDEEGFWSDEEDEGWGFNLSDCFNNIRLINPEKDKDDGNDSDYLTEDENEDELQFDRIEVPVKDITAKDWEDVAFRDLSPLVVLVYERYHRPIENMRAREDLKRAINIFWDFDKAAPRAVRFDATEEPKLASLLNCKETPVIIFIKNGKVVHRQKEVLAADDLAKVMAYFYYKANLPECLKSTKFAEENLPILT